MAKKGQKFNKYDDEFREQVALDYLNGKGTYMSIANTYGISWKTVEGWVRKYKSNGTTALLPKGKIPEKEINYKERYEILKKFQAFLKEQQEKK